MILDMKKVFELIVGRRYYWIARVSIRGTPNDELNN